MVSPDLVFYPEADGLLRVEEELLALGGAPDEELVFVLAVGEEVVSLGVLGGGGGVV